MNQFRKKQFSEKLPALYLCLLSVYALFREVVPCMKISDSPLLAFFFFGSGLLLIPDNYRKERMGRPMNLWMVFFLLLCIFSTLKNYHYAPAANCRAIGWMLLYFAGIYSYARNRMTESLFRTFSKICVMTGGIFALLSLTMYLFDVDYTTINEKMIGFVSSQGFSKVYGRLWGIFSDPNYASVYLLIIVTMGIGILLKETNIITRIVVTGMELAMTAYIILSGSRTVQLSFLAGCLTAVCMILLQFFREKRSKFFAISLLFGAVCLFAFGGRLLPEIKESLNAAITAQTQEKVQMIWNEIYQLGEVEIIQNTADEEEQEHSGVTAEEKQENPGQTDPTISDQTDPTISGQTDPTISDQTDSTISGQTDPTSYEDAAGSTETSFREEAAGSASFLARSDILEKKDISNGRFSIWMDAIEIFTYAPWIGTSPRGACNFGRDHCPDNEISQFGYSAHSTWLEILMGTGLIGFLLVMGMLGKVLLSILRFCRKGISYGKGFRAAGAGSCSCPCREICCCILAELLCAAYLLSDLFFIFTFGGIVFWTCVGFLEGGLE